MDHKEEISCNLFMWWNLFRGLGFLFFLSDKAVVADELELLSWDSVMFTWKKYSLTVTLHLWILLLDAEHQIKRPLKAATNRDKEMFCALCEHRVVLGWDLSVYPGLNVVSRCPRARQVTEVTQFNNEVIWFLSVWHPDIQWNYFKSFAVQYHNTLSVLCAEQLWLCL